jgi:hypothetical protein
MWGGLRKDESILYTKYRSGPGNHILKSAIILIPGITIVGRGSTSEKLDIQSTLVHTSTLVTLTAAGDNVVITTTANKELPITEGYLHGLQKNKSILHVLYDHARKLRKATAIILAVRRNALSN